MLDLDQEVAGTLSSDEPRLEDGYELVDGEPVEKKMGAEASYVTVRLGYLISAHLDRAPLGWALGAETGYRCFPNRPKLIRKPDMSFVRFGRLPGERAPRGDITIPPDLAVEVVSPNDLYDEADRKIGEYIDASVRLVWVVNPETQTVHVYHPDGTARRLRAAETLGGEDVLPGFAVAVSELFRPPTPAPAGPA
jgi:Uma2 family endonuclease